MQPHIYYLDQDENKALSLIYQGFSSRHITTHCPMPLFGFHTFCAEIRRKTGIQNIRSIPELKAFYAKYSAALPNIHTDPDQTRALRKFVECKYLTGTAYALQMAEDAAQALIDQACRTAAIFTRDERAKRAQARLYLALFKPNFAPLLPTEERILRLKAEGLSLLSIMAAMGASSPLAFIKGKAKDACQRLGFDVPGRNAQATLLRTYFAYLDAQRENTMDDPMF